MARDSVIRTTATIVGVLLALGLVWRSSSAAFSDTTDNTGNSFGAASFTLTDDDGGSALFSSTGMVPGTTATGCIEITYGGDATPGGPVEFYASFSDDTVVAGDGLSDDLDVTIELAAAGATCSALGSPTSLLSTTLDAVNGIGSPLSTGWTPTLVTDVTRAFRITVTLGADTASDAQGEVTTAGFTWTVSS